MGNPGALLLMAGIGAVVLPATAYWDEWSRAKKMLCVAWIVIWIGPGLAALWITGVVG